jgi:methionine aminopeptidase
MNYGTKIPIRSRRETDSMREAGRHVGEILLELRAMAEPGLKTSEFDRAVAQAIEDRG